MLEISPEKVVHIIFQFREAGLADLKSLCTRSSMR